jgi:hypothetical protein
MLSSFIIYAMLQQTSLNYNLCRPKVCLDSTAISSIMIVVIGVHSFLRLYESWLNYIVLMYLKSQTDVFAKNKNIFAEARDEV